MRMGADGVRKMGLENLENFTYALPVFGDTLPLFFGKCASQYVLLRFLVFSCFTFAISETFLFFGIFCSIFPLFSLSVLLVLFTIP